MANIIITNLSGDSVTWTAATTALTLDVGSDLTISDADYAALGDIWTGASLTVQRVGTAKSDDIFALNTTGALFTVSGADLQSGGLTFATFTNAGGVLSVSFTGIGTVATKALVEDVMKHITYTNARPSGDTSIRFTLSDGTTPVAADVTVASDFIYVTNTTDTATIDVSDGVSFSEAVAIAAADTTGSQTLVLDSTLTSTTSSLPATLSLTENLTIRQEGLLRLGGTNTLTVGSGLTLTFTGTSGKGLYLVLPLAGSGTIAANLSGSSTLLFNSANSLTGDIRMVGGYIEANKITSFGTATLVATSTSSSSIGINRNNNAPTIANNIRFEPNTRLSFGGSGDFTLSGNVDLGGATSKGVFYVAGPLLTLSGAISNGALSVERGIVTLSGTNNGTNNTYTTTNIGATGMDSTLIIAGDNNLGSGAIYLSRNSSLVSTSNVLEITGSGVTIDNNIVLNAYNGGGTIKNSNAVTLSGTISGVNSVPTKLYKTGTGVLTLSGTSNYASGVLIVEAGAVNITGALNNATSATIASGATFGGSGAFGGATTLQSGGKLGIDSAANTFTIDDNLVLSSGATYSVEIGGATAGTLYDQTIVNGTVTLTGATLSVTTLNSFVPGATDSFTIIANDGTDVIVGTFTGLAEGATVVAGGINYVISYKGGTGNDVVLSMPDMTPPTFDGAPATANVTTTTLDVSASIDEAGTMYYVVVADGATAPSVAQIKVGHNASDAAALASGSQAVSTGTFSHTFNLTGLTAVTAYDVYVVAQDAATTPNVMALATKVDVTTSAPVAPTITNLNGDSVTWTAAATALTLDVGSNLTISDADYGDTWTGASLTVQRVGTAKSDDIFALNTTGALFTVSGADLQSGGLTFATFTNAGGVLSVNFTSSGTAATKALVEDVMKHITYTNARPSGDTSIRFTLSDGTTPVAADVTVASDFIYVTNVTDTATINVNDGVSFSEAVAIAAADTTGSQTLVLDSSLTNSSSDLPANLSLTENLTIRQEGLLSLGGTNTLTVGSGLTLTFTGTGLYLMPPLAGSGTIAANLNSGTSLLFTSTSNSDFNGDIKMVASYIQAESSTSFGNATLVATSTSSSSSGIKKNNANASTIANNIRFEPNTRLYVGGAGDFTLSGNVDLGGATSKGVFYVSSTTGFQLILSGAISNGALSVEQGTVILSGTTNTYTTTNIGFSAVASTLKIAGDNNLGSGAIYLIPNCNQIDFNIQSQPVKERSPSGYSSIFFSPLAACAITAPRVSNT